MAEEAVTQASRRAMELESQFWGCSQAVLGALQEALNIGDTESFRAGTLVCGRREARGDVRRTYRRTDGTRHRMRKKQYVGQR